ncbi:LINE-1 reverse transcriptase isogeny [Gossypium australe]|uniref:LINE-1 reverse transcriptase isogeny n=1 Tax=Gossypium australe TaxID=47621 RepID=A0A5B6VQ98_9ROSI|nr:LINE-1 reverse transcriptase isogeny [Gossypium australe]
MECISSISYFVVLNRETREVVTLARGFRQGDPLSPYLFLICNEGLSTLMRLTMMDGLLKGAKIYRQRPEISHLLFADDCILFGKATKERALVLKQILQEYEKSSGQCVNFDKSFKHTITTKKNDL